MANKQSLISFISQKFYKESLIRSLDCINLTACVLFLFFQITLRADQKNWRQRIETLKHNREHIEELFNGTEKKLNQISNDIGQDLEKTASREKYINQKLDGLITELRSSHDKLAKAKVFFQELKT